MAKKDEKEKQKLDPEQQRLEKSNKQLDALARKILASVDTGYAERQRLSNSDTSMQRSFQREMSIVNNRSHGSVIDFVRSVRSDESKGRKNTRGNGLNRGKQLTADPYDMLMTNAGDIFNYFKSSNQSRYLQLSDLKFISKFIPIIGEAVKVALNSVCASDTISDTIARQIILPDMPKEEDLQVRQTIESFEKEKKLLRKLKNITFKKAIVTGEDYIYSIPYKDLFAEYDRIMKKREAAMKRGNVTRANKATETYLGTATPGTPTTETYMTGWDYNVGAAVECCISNEATDRLVSKYKAQLATEAATNSGTLSKGTGYSVSAKNKNSVMDAALEAELRDFCKSFQIVDSTIPYAALEDASSFQLEKYRNTFGGQSEVNFDEATPEVAADPTKRSRNKWDDLNGLYIKFIDTKNLVPIKLFDDVVLGYFHIHSTKRKTGPSVGFNKTDIFNTGNSPMLSYVNISERKKEEAALALVDEISQMVLDSFSSKFVVANQEYVDLIANVIIANGLVDQDYKIQFIPAEYIIGFKINEDENGNGESLIADSLFAAKLLLYLLTTQLLNFINLSGNRQIAHIQKGPIDVSTSNHIQDVIRNLQETKVSFNDLLSTNLVYSKLSRNVNLALPQSKNGTRLVEFETQEGQDVNMDTDFLEKLEDLVRVGTNVPITKDMLGQPQLAKKLESESITYAGTVASLQSDLEGPLTDLYKRIIESSNLPDDLKTKCINGLEIKLPRPKAFENTNNSEFLGTAVSMLQQAVGAYVGENNQDEDAATRKDMLVAELIKDITPFIDWQGMEEADSRIQIEIQKKKAEATAKAGVNTSGGTDMGTDTGEEEF